MKTKSKEAILKSIPKSFTLNAGHVTFFYDKQSFLTRRFYQLASEMECRGYIADMSRVVAFDGFDSEFNNDWQSTPNDDALVHDRIALRISQKPHLYKD